MLNLLNGNFQINYLMAFHYSLVAVSAIIICWAYGNILNDK